MSFIQTLDSASYNLSDDRRLTDAVILPFPDINTSNLIGSAGNILLGLARGIRLTSVQQIEFDKGNVLTAHRVDGGYALTQRGGSQDDRAFIRILLVGPGRFIIKDLIQSLAVDKQTPLALFAKEGIFLKCQIESTKVIATFERRQAIIMHVILRQLRSFEGNFIATVGRLTTSALIPSYFEQDSIYTRTASQNINSGGQNIALAAVGGIANLFN